VSEHVRQEPFFFIGRTTARSLHKSRALIPAADTSGDEPIIDGADDPATVETTSAALETDMEMDQLTTSLKNVRLYVPRQIKFGRRGPNK
jgi:hypothetical protein